MGLPGCGSGGTGSGYGVATRRWRGGVPAGRGGMIVDSHCHAWTVWPYDTAVPDPHHRGTIEQLLFEMDREQVDRAVVICARIDHNPDNNAYVVQAAKAHGDRLVPFPDVDSAWSSEYHTPGAADRLASAIDR